MDDTREGPGKSVAPVGPECIFKDRVKYMWRTGVSREESW